jgi:hypothetical protein
LTLRGAARMHAVHRPLALALWLALMLCVSHAFAEVDPPMADPAEPITVTAEQSQRWQEGEYVVWMLHGRCQLQQGQVIARSADAVLWVEPGDPLHDEPSKIIAYLENDVSIDYARNAKPHRETGKRAQTIQARSWLGRFHTTSGIDLRAPMTGAQPPSRPQMVERSMEALNWSRRNGVEQAQYLAPAPGAAPGAAQAQPMARNVSVRSRSSVPMQAESLPSNDPQETIVTISSGVQVIISGIENVPGVQTGVAIIEADRVVIWTTALAGLNLSGQSIEQSGGRWEFYLEGNIIFREGDRVIYADRMYYNVNMSRGTILNAEMLTPVPQYDGLVRLKADVLQQVNQQQFQAFGGALTSSRMGVPSYWFQAENVSFQDEQRPRIDPVTGQPAIDPVTGEAAVAHQLNARSMNNFLYLGGVPLLYWPVMSTDLQKPNFYIDEVRFGSDKVFGTQAMIDWDLFQMLGIREPPAGTQWDLSTDYLSRRGFGLGTSVNYNREGFLGIPGPAIGKWDLWGLKDRGMDDLGKDRLSVSPETDWRGRALAQHRQQLGNGFQVTAELGLISDRNFLEQYFEYEWDELKDQTTGIELKRYVDNRSWDIIGDLRVNDFFTQTDWIRGDYFMLGQSLIGDKLTWYSHSQAAYAHLQIATPPSPLQESQGDVFNLLPWEVESEGLRAVSRQELDLPFQLGALKVVPYALGEVGTWGENIYGDSVTRLYGQAGVRASLPFWRVDPGVQSMMFNLNGLSHKVSFDVDFFYADANQDLQQFPLYDPVDDDSTEHFRNRFLQRTFIGASEIPEPFQERYYAMRSGMQRWVTSPTAEVADDLMLAQLGIRQRWQTKRGAPGQERIVDWITLDVEGTVFPEAQRDDYGSSFGMLDYDFAWHIGDRFTLLSDGYLDFFQYEQLAPGGSTGEWNGLQTVMVGAQITRPEVGNLFLGYRWVDGPITSQLIQSSLAYRMTEKWILTAGATVDTTNTGNIGQSLDVTRIGESLLVRLGFNVDTSRENIGMNISIEPRFLPRNRLGRVGGVQIPPAGAYGLE